MFYSNDHLPVHVHVKNGDFESKFEFIYEDGKFKKKLIAAKIQINNKKKILILLK